MELHTASELITLVKKIESESARLYEDLSQRYGKDADVLLSFAKENGKNIVQIERAYYEVISDALEGCFAFNINPDDYALEAKLAEGVSYPDALKKALEMEKTIIAFYAQAVEQSSSLMADVSRAFTIVARKRKNRIPKLESLLSSR